MNSNIKEYTMVTREMVEQLIQEHYSADSNDVGELLQNIARTHKPFVDIDKIIADTISNREMMAANVSEYEDELVHILDLATVLAERRRLNNDNNNESQDIDGYINYLYNRINTVIPDVIEILQLLK